MADIEKANNAMNGDVNPVENGEAKPQNQLVGFQSMEMHEIISQISPEASIANKITPEHITILLENQKHSTSEQIKYKKHRNWFSLIVIVIAIAAVFGIILLLRDTPEVMERIIISIVSLAIGAFGGYGDGTRKKNKDDDD